LKLKKIALMKNKAMTKEEIQKEKELLLNVLKDGLPYGLQLQVTDINGFTFNGELLVLSKNWCRLDIADPVKRAKVKNQMIPLNYIYIKPYLRPMSSMSESERFEVEQIIGYDVEVRDDFLGLFSPSIKRLSYTELLAVFKWLNANHFDYRGLIERGLAIKVTEENNPYEI